jgi:hypothetical protein
MNLGPAISSLVDSAPGHQETPKPPSGGFIFLNDFFSVDASFFAFYANI